MNGIEISGFDDFENLLQDMTISDLDEKKAMKKAIEVIAVGVERDTPIGNSGKLKKIKRSIKKEVFATVGKIELGAFYGMFDEYGTSHSKKHVGFFETSVNRTQDQAIEVLKNELLNKVG